MKHFVSKDIAAELENVTPREIELRSAAGEIESKASDQTMRNGRPKRLFAVHSLSPDAQKQYFNRSLAGVWETPDSGQLSDNRENLRDELAAPSTQLDLIKPAPLVNDETRAALHGIDRETADYRYEVIKPLLDYLAGYKITIELGTGEKIKTSNDLVAWLAAQRGISQSTIWNWQRRFTKGDGKVAGYIALADRKRSDKGTFRSLEGFPKAQQLIYQKYCGEEQDVKATHAALEKLWPTLYNHGSKAPSYTTVRHYIERTFPRALRTFAREGEKAFNDKHAPYILRTVKNLRSNEIWVSDHMQHDVMVVNDMDLAGLDPWQSFRPWLTAFMDVRSRTCVGFAWSVNPSSDSICTALRVGLSQIGKPRSVYVDNGKDYKKVSKSTVTRNGFKIELPLAAQGVLQKLEIECTHTEKYHGQSKPIESWFRTLHAKFDKHLHGAYCGAKDYLRPDACNLVLKNHQEWLDKKRAQRPAELPLFSEFVPMAIAWITKTYNAEHRHSGEGMDGRTPYEVFAAAMPAKKPQPEDIVSLAPLFWRTEERVLQEGACVSINKLRYEPADLQSAANLRLHTEKKVFIACDPYNIGDAVATDGDGKPLGVMRAQNLLPWGPQSYDELRARKRDERKYRRAVKDLHRGLTANPVAPSEADELRAAAGIVSVTPDQNVLAVRPQRRRFAMPAAAVAPDYVDDVVDDVRKLMNEEGGD